MFHLQQSRLKIDPLPSFWNTIFYVFLRHPKHVDRHIGQLCIQQSLSNTILHLESVFLSINNNDTLHKDSYLTENIFVHTCSYFQHSLAKSLKANSQEGNPIEMNSLVGPINDLDHSPFRSLRPKSQISSSGGGVSSPKTQGPVVCSVAPNLPARPPSSSDTDSIRKNHWDMDYEGELWRCVSSARSRCTDVGF